MTLTKTQASNFSQSNVFNNFAGDSPFACMHACIYLFNSVCSFQLDCA